MDNFHKVSQPCSQNLYLLFIGCLRWRSKASIGPGNEVESKLFCKMITFDGVFTVRISEHIQFASSLYWFKYFLPN